MKILMTCFGAFGGFTTNSTELALSKLNYLDIDRINLPVSYPDAYVVLKQLMKECDFIIMLGMAASRDKISIEERAKNLLEFKIPDNNRQIITNRLISDEGPEYIYSKVDIDNLITILNKDFDVYKSSDAGTYICNYLYYKVLETIDVPSIFVHIPNYQTDDEFEKLHSFLITLINYIKGENKWENHCF